MILVRTDHPCLRVERHTKVLVVSLEHAAGKLRPVVSDDSIQGPIPTDDGLDKLRRRLLIDFDHMGHFRPLGELVDGYVEIPVHFDGLGKRS
jgi:hypothetical protein